MTEIFIQKKICGRIINLNFKAAFLGSQIDICQFRARVVMKEGVNDRI